MFDLGRTIIEKNWQQCEFHLTSASFCHSTRHQRLPSLDKEGKPWPRATAGVVRRVTRTANPQRGGTTLPRWRSATAVAAHHIPSSTEEGSFSAIFQLRIDDRRQQ